MSWPANTGPWNPGIPMSSEMNVGYAAEQWTAMQQQNWQQWTQWQQQYAQWQSQFGEKYTEQMQAMQSMAGGVAGNMPPLPSAMPPRAPPPPDQPPPPPPHENNQPLYKKPSQPTPVSAPTTNRNNAPYNNTTGNNQNNKEALKNLAEEERLFDIQFQKWEEEIKKWRRENINHPDKQAYKEYEAKFEACRLQLLERRAQMNQKKDKLLSGATPAAASAPAQGGNIPTAIPPPLKNSTFNNPQSQKYNNKPSNYSDNNAQQSYNNKNQNYKDDKQNYQGPRGSNYQQYDNSNFNRNTNVDPQDRYESYENMEDYSQANNYGDDSNNPSFLPQTTGKGIPGLDLVVEPEKVKKPEDVIDITQDPPPKRGMPDYSTISKGINNILGDEKLMNILSSIRGQAPPGPPSASNSENQDASNTNVQSMDHGGPSHGSGYNNPPPNNQWDRNNGNNQWNQDNEQNQFGNRQMPQNRQQNYRPNQNQNYRNQNRGYYNDQSGGQDQWNYNQQGNYDEGNYDEDGNYNNEGNYGQEDEYRQDMNQRGGPAPRGNVPPMRGSGPPGPPRGNVPAPRPLMEINTNRDMLDGFNSNQPPPMPPPTKSLWPEIFTPSLIVEYEHQPLRLKAREFIEPVHTFDYNHISKDGESKNRDFEKEVDGIFGRRLRDEEYNTHNRDRDYYRPPHDREGDRYARDMSRQFERRVPRDDRDDYRSRVPPREEFDRRNTDNRYDERRRDDRDRNRRDDPYKDRERDSLRDRERGDRDRDRERDRERERDNRDNRDRYRDTRRSRSRDRDNRKRARSKESSISIISDGSIHSKKAKDVDDKNSRQHIVMIDDILEPPGRGMRPAKIVIILRGPPGSGKSYLAKLIRDREAEHGGTARIFSIDDYFMQEGEVEEKDPATGKIIKKPLLKYEYDSKLEETYENSLKRAFKRSCTDGYFSFLIYDSYNEHLKSYADVWNFARQNGFQVYVCTMELDPQVCHKRNIHGRTLDEVQVVAARFSRTPPQHIQLDPTTLLQSAAITDVHMEDVDDHVVMEDVQHEVESVFTSKWEKMDDATRLARLDGTSKPLRPSQLSMEDYLQLDEWTPNKAQPGKKTVRWADIEERRQQEKMRAIGFVVGQTDWNRMTDPTMGSSALTQTKYIERVRRN